MGFIKIDRNIIKSSLFEDEHLLRMMIYCRCKAFYQDKTIDGMFIPRGSFPTSIAILSQETGYSIQRIKTLLSKLTTMNYITKTATRSGTIISIVDYDVTHEADHENIESEEEYDTVECSQTTSTSYLTNESTSDEPAFNPENKAISNTQFSQDSKRFNDGFSRPEQQLHKNICKEKEKKNILHNPPSFVDVDKYVRSKGYKFDVRYFYRYCESKHWKTLQGDPIVDWKRYVDRWSDKNPAVLSQTAQGSKEPDLSILDFSRFTVKGG